MISMKKFLNSLLILCMILILPVSFFIAAKNGLFRVKNIEVTMEEPGVHPRPQAYGKYLENLKLKLAKFNDGNLWDIDFQSIYSIVLIEGWIESIEIYRRFPQTLKLEVKTKPSIAIYVGSKGVLRLMNNEGALLPAIEATESPELPVIQDSRVINDEEMKARVVGILNELPLEGPLSLKTLAEIGLGAKNEIWLTHLETKSQIKFGDKNIATKSSRVAKVLEYLEHNNLKGRVIDADFSKKVLVKLRNDR